MPRPANDPPRQECRHRPPEAPARGLSPTTEARYGVDSPTVRGLAPGLKVRLTVRAAHNSRSIEAESRATAESRSKHIDREINRRLALGTGAVSIKDRAQSKIVVIDYLAMALQTRQSSTRWALE